MKKILIADDHNAIRKGVKQILANEFGDMEFGEAANSVEVAKVLNEKEWDLLILDMDMPGRNGFDVLKLMKDAKAKTKVLMYSHHPEEQIAVRAIYSGAAGYLSKDAPDSELVKAVQLVLNGKKYISSSVSDLLVVSLLKASEVAPHELLSNREYQTLLLIAKGKSISTIGGELSLSAPTISTYRSRILEKMGMRTNSELTYYAVHNKLL